MNNKELMPAIYAKKKLIPLFKFQVPENIIEKEKKIYIIMHCLNIIEGEKGRINGAVERSIIVFLI